MLIFNFSLKFGSLKLTSCNTHQAVYLIWLRTNEAYEDFTICYEIKSSFNLALCAFYSYNTISATNLISILWQTFVETAQYFELCAQTMFSKFDAFCFHYETFRYISNDQRNAYIIQIIIITTLFISITEYIFIVKLVNVNGLISSSHKCKTFLHQRQNAINKRYECVFVIQNRKPVSISWKT